MYTLILELHALPFVKHICTKFIFIFIICDGLMYSSVEGFRILPINKVRPSSNSLRLNVDEEYITELAQSMESNGQLQPILVRPLQSGDYEIVAGEQRYLATRRAGLVTIPCIIKNMGDREAFEASLIENVQRKDLTDYELAVSLKRFLKKFPDNYPTHQSLAAKLGKSRAWITNHLRMLELDFPQEILEKLTEYQARTLLSIPPQIQKIILDEIVETENIPSAREIMRKNDELNDYPAQTQGIIFEASKPWHHNAQKYVPQNVIKSISGNILRGTKQYKLKVLKYTIESAWNYIEKQGVIKRMLEESANPLVCKICKQRFFDTKVFNNHKCGSNVSRETLT
jgi:ParB family chromosome partitioning protein